MKTKLFVSVCALSIAQSGCAIDEEETTGETEQAFVLFEAGAIEEGYALQDGGTSRLPMELRAFDEIAIEHEVGEEILVAEPGELLYVRADGFVERWDLGDEIATDRVQILADERTAHSLSVVLDAELEELSDGFVLIAPDILAGLAAQPELAGLAEVIPVVLDSPEDDEADVAEPSRAGSHQIDRVLEESLGKEHAIPHRGPPVLLPESPTQPLTGAFVGATQLVQPIQASPFESIMNAPVACDDDVAGTWISREYYEQYGDWYLFTLEVSRDPANPTSLNGAILSRSWSGEGEMTEPSTCDALPTSAGWGSFDWTVGMTAKGAMTREGFSFEGTSWDVQRERCGAAPRVGQYNLDAFTGKVKGGWIQAVNNDGDRSVNDPHLFRRVSCNVGAR